MKIDQNKYVWDWFLKSRIKTTGFTVPLTPRNIDTIQISDKTKRQLKNIYIENALNSGKPMTGVTYEEYCDYYYDKHGYHKKDNMQREYKQALKGDKASLREKEWRTNPEYVIPFRLYNAPEIAADRNAALEKYRNGEKLSEWENDVMCTIVTTESGSGILDEAETERYTKNMQNMLDNTLSKLGIELSDKDELDIEVWGYSMSINGNISGENLKLINEALTEKAISFQNLYHRYHRDESKKGGLPLVYLWDAEKILKDYGGGSVFDIGKDKDGNFTGLPGNLGEFIKENAIGKFGFGVDEKYKDRKDDIEKALYMREAFNSVIETVKKSSYSRLKNMTCKLTYKNGILSC